MLKPLLASAAFIALAAGAALAQEAAKGFDATYGVSIAGLPAGEYKLDIDFAGDSYKASTTMRTTGLVRAAVGKKQDYNASAEGVITADAVRPAAYRHQGGKRNRLVEVSYSGGDVVTTATPSMGMGDPPATKAQKLGSTDNVSAFVDMLVAPGEKNPCDRTLKVFDGRTRFDLVMSPNGTQKIATKAWKGTAQRCAVKYRFVAGPKPDPEELENYKKPLTFLFAPLPNGWYAPVRVEMPTADVGVAVLEAKSFKASGV